MFLKRWMKWTISRRAHNKFCSPNSLERKVFFGRTRFFESPNYVISEFWIRNPDTKTPLVVFSRLMERFVFHFWLPPIWFFQYSAPFFEKKSSDEPFRATRSARAFWSLLNTNLSATNSYDVSWRVQGRFSRKFKLCPLTLELGIKGFLTAHEQIKKKSYDAWFRVYTSIFKNISISPVDLETGYVDKSTCKPTVIHRMNFSLLYSCSWRKKLYRPNFMVNERNCNILENKRVNPQLYTISYTA